MEYCTPYKTQFSKIDLFLLDGWEFFFCDTKIQTYFPVYFFTHMFYKKKLSCDCELYIVRMIKK